jgi:opacity protein-like surface antigen
MGIKECHAASRVRYNSLCRHDMRGSSRFSPIRLAKPFTERFADPFAKPLVCRRQCGRDMAARRDQIAGYILQRRRNNRTRHQHRYLRSRSRLQSRPRYKLPLGFRIEVEGGYAHYTTASASPLSTNGAFPTLNGSRLGSQSGGAHNEYSATFNAFYDVPVSDWYTPYIGAGVGVVGTNIQTGVFAGPGGIPQFTQIGRNATDALMIAEAGMTIKIDAKWAIVPSYRFEKVVTNGTLPENNNIFKLGVRYSLQ